MGNYDARMLESVGCFHVTRPTRRCNDFVNVPKFRPRDVFHERVAVNPIDSIRPRADLLRRLRRVFDSAGFCEVQPPCVSRDCVVDVHLDPIEIDGSQLGLGRTFPNGQTVPPTFYLPTSPESAMKRMLAMGAPSIYSIGPVFRRGELGDLHNVEFTMLEWYQRDGNAASAYAMIDAISDAVLGIPSARPMTYRHAFADRLGLDPLDATLDELRVHVADIDADLAMTIGDDRDDLLDVIMSEIVQPKLGHEGPVLITQYPLTQAALAKPCASDGKCAERFEWFYRGVELANGYEELLDADELQRRYEINNQKRESAGRHRLPSETTLVQAMRSGLPRCSGVALGVDRLLMLQTNAKTIGDVIVLPTEVA